MISDAIILLGLLVTLGLGVGFGAATVRLACADDISGTIAGVCLTATFFTAAFVCARILGV